MSDYVRRLREKVGRDFLLMPSVAALIRDDAGRVLLVQHVEGRWQYPGGAVDPDETPQDALRRECREEIGVDVELGRVVGVFGGPLYRIRYENGDEAGYVVSVFEASIVAGEPVASDDETQAVAWYAPEQLDGVVMHAAVRETLRASLRPGSA